MDVVIAGRRVRLDDQHLLGIGGEARVFRFGDRAVKIYHPLDPSQPQAERLRRDKLAKLRDFPTGLPPEVVAPEELVSDRRGQVLGYVMAAVSGGEDLMRLAQRSYREGVIGNAQVVSLFQRIHTVLHALHARGLVVGDLNDTNLLFAGERPWFIDADSMQFGGHACAVGHERFLDPRLYGVDLAAAPAFTVGSDWYAYAVLLFASLLYVHPYGGQRRGLPTLLRRAEARHSILRPDVVYPRAAVHFGILPDPLLAWFEAVFDRDARDPLPSALLQLRWTRCGCGLEHARAACPACATVGVAQPAIRVQGRCSARFVFRTSGRVLAAAWQGGLRYLYQEGGVVRREDGSTVMTQALAPGLRFSIAGPATWLGLRGRLLRLQHGAVVERVSTGTVGARSAFAASAAGCVRTEQEWLVDGSSGLRLGKILEGQTLLFTGDRLGLGLYRAGLLAFAFLFRPGQAGLTDVKLPPIDGRLLDIDCVFDEHHALVLLATERDGKRTHAMYLIAHDGRVLAEARGAPEEARLLGSLAGKALAHGRVLCITDEGLLALRVESGRFVEDRLFTDTASFVSLGDELLPGPGGSVYVVSPSEITQLTMD